MRLQGVSKTLIWFQSLIVFSNTDSGVGQFKNLYKFQSLIVFSNTQEGDQSETIFLSFNHL